MDTARVVLRHPAYPLLRARIVLPAGVLGALYCLYRAVEWYQRHLFDGPPLQSTPADSWMALALSLLFGALVLIAVGRQLRPIVVEYGRHDVRFGRQRILFEVLDVERTIRWLGAWGHRGPYAELADAWTVRRRVALAGVSRRGQRDRLEALMTCSGQDQF